MRCLKCGREVRPEQVFCDDCLLEMAKYPVKPGTTVQLPHWSESPAVKKTYTRRRPNLSPEEQVRSLKKRVLVLTIALILALAAFAGLSYCAVTQLLKEEILPGQNYSAVDSLSPDTDDLAESAP